MKVVTVIPLQKSSNKGVLSYFTAKDIPEGSVVTVPLRNNTILGLAIAVRDVSGAKGDIKEMDFNLRKILEVKEHSIFRKEYLESVMALGEYFAASKNNVAGSLIPAIMREEYDVISQFSRKSEPAAPIIKNVKKSIGTEKMLFQAPPEERISAYKTLIREAFASKKSVFIVLPNERDIRSLLESLKKGIEQFTFALSSGMSKKKIVEKLEKISTTDHGILILGTAPYLAIPRNDIGTIIIEHESSNGYKMIQKPNIDLRIFAELFAAKINAKLILSDTLLRLETAAREDLDGLTPMHPLSYRINFDGEIAILGSEHKKVNKLSGKVQFKVLADQSIEEMQMALDRKKNVFIFSLRKGLATQTICRDCGDTLSCKNCAAPMVLHTSPTGTKRIFACNRCQSTEDGDTVCASCGSWNLMPLGIGTDTVYEAARKYFPDEEKYKIFQLDKETARNAAGAARIVKEFEDSEGAILVGTEMALFYLNDEIPLSIIASFDSLWSIPNYKMSEKIIGLMVSIIRSTREKFIIQTKNENDGALLAVANGNLLSFVREELADRKKLGYPPYKRFIKITHLGGKNEAIEANRILQEMFEEYEPEVFSGFVAKQEGKYATNALLRIHPKKWSLPELSHHSKIDENLLKKLTSLPYDFQVLVDPEDLL